MADEENISSGIDLPEITEENRTDPKTYVEARRRLLNQLGSGTISRSMDYERAKNAFAEECEANTGIPYEDAARQGMDKIGAFIGLMETSPEELLEVEKAFQQIDDVRVTMALKKSGLT